MFYRTIPCVGSVPCRSRTAYHIRRLGFSWCTVDHDLSDLSKACIIFGTPGWPFHSFHLLRLSFFSLKAVFRQGQISSTIVGEPRGQLSFFSEKFPDLKSCSTDNAWTYKWTIPWPTVLYYSCRYSSKNSCSRVFCKLSSTCVRRWIVDQYLLSLYECCMMVILFFLVGC